MDIKTTNEMIDNIKNLNEKQLLLYIACMLTLEFAQGDDKKLRLYNKYILQWSAIK